MHKSLFFAGKNGGNQDHSSFFPEGDFVHGETFIKPIAFKEREQKRAPPLFSFPSNCRRVVTERGGGKLFIGLVSAISGSQNGAFFFFYHFSSVACSLPLFFPWK